MKGEGATPHTAGVSPHSFRNWGRGAGIPHLCVEELTLGGSNRSCSDKIIYFKSTSDSSWQLVPQPLIAPGRSTKRAGRPPTCVQHAGPPAQHTLLNLSPALICWVLAHVCQKDPTLLTLRPQMSSLRDCDTTHFCCVSPRSVVLCPRGVPENASPGPDGSKVR